MGWLLGPVELILYFCVGTKHDGRHTVTFQFGDERAAGRRDSRDGS